MLEPACLDTGAGRLHFSLGFRQVTFFPTPAVLLNKLLRDEANHNVIGSRKISRYVHGHGDLEGWLGAFYET